MPEITLTQFRDILIASTTSEIDPNSTLPKKLVEYLVDHISLKAFKDENNYGLLDTKS
jgi:hypothetical protein